MAGFEDDDRRSFADVLKGQIKSLREQLDQDKDKLRHLGAPQTAPSAQGGTPPPQPGGRRYTQVDERSIGLARVWDATPGPVGSMPGALPAQPGDAGARQRDLRSMAYFLGRSFTS